MKFTALTIFPEMFTALRQHGIIRRAIASGIIALEALDVRDFATDRHRTTDDRPYGGGSGMVMKPEPLAAAIRSARSETPDAPVVLLTPQGRVFDQRMAEELAGLPGLTLVCGRYEGIDERIGLAHIDLEISIGDYVLTGGELAAMIVIDAVTRLLPGALGNEDSSEKDSFSTGLLEHAHYTRPVVHEGEPAPAVLLSGHHRNIEAWRMESSLIRTLLKRKDLLERRVLSRTEIALLEKWRSEIETIIRAQCSSGAGPLPGGQQER
jgi:tRNA (guanine37-N1)-methyltransferase